MIFALAQIAAAHAGLGGLFLLGVIGAVVSFNINIARGTMLGDGFRTVVVGVTGPTTYTTGGDPITAGQFRGGVIEYIGTFQITDGTTAFTGLYNYTTLKLMFFKQDGSNGGLVEVGNGVNLSAFVGRMLVKCK